MNVYEFHSTPPSGLVERGWKKTGSKVDGKGKKTGWRQQATILESGRFRAKKKPGD